MVGMAAVMVARWRAGLYLFVKGCQIYLRLPKRRQYAVGIAAPTLPVGV